VFSQFYSLLLGCILSCFIGVSAYAEVAAFDAVGVAEKPVVVKVLTKEHFFPSGGVVVHVFWNQWLIGRILTGGDGYGYLKRVFTKTGLHTLESRTENDTASSLILVIKPEEKTLAIEIDGPLKETAYDDAPREGGLEAVKKLSKNYRILYLVAQLSLTNHKKWLNNHGFPESVVLEVNRSFFDDLKERSITPHAVVSSSALIAKAPDFVQKNFSFEPPDAESHVEDWNSVVDALMD
jgi:hypothetical protein